MREGRGRAAPRASGEFRRRPILLRLGARNEVLSAPGFSDLLYPCADDCHVPRRASAGPTLEVSGSSRPFSAFAGDARSGVLCPFSVPTTQAEGPWPASARRRGPSRRSRRGAVVPCTGAQRIFCSPGGDIEMGGFCQGASWAEVRLEGRPWPTFRGHSRRARGNGIFVLYALRNVWRL